MYSDPLEVATLQILVRVDSPDLMFSSGLTSGSVAVPTELIYLPSPSTFCQGSARNCERGEMQ